MTWWFWKAAHDTLDTKHGQEPKVSTPTAKSLKSSGSLFLASSEWIKFAFTAVNRQAGHVIPVIGTVLQSFHKCRKMHIHFWCWEFADASPHSSHLTTGSSLNLRIQRYAGWQIHLQIFYSWTFWANKTLFIWRNLNLLVVLGIMTKCNFGGD